MSTTAWPAANLSGAFTRSGPAVSAPDGQWLARPSADASLYLHTGAVDSMNDDKDDDSKVVYLGNEVTRKEQLRLELESLGVGDMSPVLPQVWDKEVTCDGS